MSILNKLAALRTAESHDARPAQVPMSPEQIAQMSAKLKAQNRVSVYPNRFDVNKPFAVSIRKDNVWTNHGAFTNVDVAAAVGSLVGMAKFGAKALKGNFDQAIAEAHPEFTAWLEDERNADIIAAIQGGQTVEAPKKEPVKVVEKPVTYASDELIPDF